jgi:hypothetical protein
MIAQPTMANQEAVDEEVRGFTVMKVVEKFARQLFQ